jgi:hypothetical protein
MKLQIVKADGQPIGATDIVGLSAIPVHAMFSQIDILLQQENISSSCNLYPFRAYTQKLLETATSPGYPQSDSQLYILDGTPGIEHGNFLDQADPGEKTQKNEGLAKRALYTSLGRVVDLESNIHADICRQDRYILNGVDMRVRLFPTQNAFRLMTKSAHQYQVKIVDIYLKVCKVAVSPEVILAHNEILQTKPAVYPYYKSALKSFTVPQGQYTASVEDPFQSVLPSKLYVFFVSAAAFNGDYRKNPFFYQHYNIQSAAFYVDGLSVPNQPLKMDFAHRDFIVAYNSLLDTAGKTEANTPFDISPSRFSDGFTILAFNLESSAVDSLDSWVRPISAHARLELRFNSPLPEAINVLMLGVYPQVMYIDKARNVSTTSGAPA